MADIFVSYSHADAEKADVIESHLELQDWTVFRDTHLLAGDGFTARIRKEIDAAACVVVLWSAEAADSDWVQAEADAARRRARLVPVLLDAVELPLPFRVIQELDLSRWTGADRRALAPLVAAVAAKVEPATAAGLEAAARISLDRLDSELVPSEGVGTANRMASLARLFAAEVRSFPGNGYDHRNEPERLFAATVEAADPTGRKRVLRISGPAGTEPRTLLACIYLDQLRRYRADQEAEAYPIWLDLRDYDGIHSPRSRLRRHLRRITRFVEDHPELAPVLCLAGFDNFTEHRNALQDLAAERMGVSQIVAYELAMEYDEMPEVDPGNVPGGPMGTVNLGRLDPDSDEARQFVDAYAAASHTPTSKLSGILGRCRFGSIDLASLAIARVMTALDVDDPSRCGDYFYRYAVDELLPRHAQPRRHHRPQDSLAAASRYAYEYVIQGVVPPRREHASAEWQIVHVAKDLTQFLVAKRIAECALADAPTEAEKAVLRRSYSHQINRFTRDVVNASSASKIRFVERAKAFLDVPTPDAVAIVSFLLGRLEGSTARRTARLLLESTRDRLLADYAAWDRPMPEDDRFNGLLFSLRSIYVSLIYLNDDPRASRESDEYIDWLIEDEQWNRINREFHLEYYGDIELLAPDAMRDDSEAPFPRTYRRLTQKIKAGLAGKAPPHFDLDVFTLFSLAQPRHLAGLLEPEIREQLVHLADRLAQTSSAKLRYRRLRLYVAMVRRHLEVDRFGLGAVAEDLYRIKSVRREGWVKRRVPDPESVADHMYGAFLLAFTYLAPRSGSRPYDRDRILKMLLIHDLAESETGDIVGKTDEQKELESQWFRQASLLSTYRDLAGLEELGDLWAEFCEQSSLNAKIAKDFDKLDQLAQLYLYRELIPGFDEWRDGLDRAIVTDEGRRVFDDLHSHFEPV